MISNKTAFADRVLELLTAEVPEEGALVGELFKAGFELGLLGVNRAGDVTSEAPPALPRR